MEKMRDLLVIGAGAGGLVVAIGATKAGKSVLLIEKGNYGGDCTNFGCIPSKALIAAGLRAKILNTPEALGVTHSPTEIFTDHAMKHVHKSVNYFLEHETPEALNTMGVETLTGSAAFTSSHSLEVTDSKGTHKIQFKKCVIATGSAPLIPSIKGLKDVNFLTNETIFSLERIPKHLLIIGAGPIGCELGQAFSHLGAKVSIFSSNSVFLMREEPETQEIMLKHFREQGIDLHLNTLSKKVRTEGEEIIIETKEGEEFRGSHLMMATGRKTNLESLDLDQANINYNDNGIFIDSYGKSSQKHIFAIGDVTGPPFFTHRAEAHARTVLRNLLVPWIFYQKIPQHPFPRVTFTHPEIASVGLTEQEAKKNYTPSSLAIYHLPLDAADRSIVCENPEGFIKVITKKWSSKILGATIVAPRAGEMITEITTAMKAKLPFREIASIIHPYPTYNQGIRKVADLWLTQTMLPALKSLFSRGKS